VRHIDVWDGSEKGTRQNAKQEAKLARLTEIDFLGRVRQRFALADAAAAVAGRIGPADL
jgi:hypothetical protein